MAQLTEAACLLNAGTRYGRRLLLTPIDDGPPIFAGFKEGAFSLYFGDAPIFHFDLEGRWQRAYIDDKHYLKALDASVQSIDRVREGEGLVLKRRTLRFDETVDLDGKVKDVALDLSSGLGSRRFLRNEPDAGVPSISDEELDSFLQKIAEFDGNAWFSQRERYLGLYGPLPFLPPDSLNALILQGTIGRRFGIQGETKPSRVRSVDEFQRHAEAAKRFHGRRIEQSKSLFLGGSDLLLEASENLGAYLEIVANVFPIAPAKGREKANAPGTLNGIQTFLDRFGSKLPSSEEWRGWKALGLSRVTLGIESGDSEIRELYGKGWRNEDLVKLVVDLEEAEIAVGLVVLTGTTPSFDIDATAALISTLPMKAGEIVSVIDASELSGSSDPLAASKFLAMKEGLKDWRAARKTKTVAYNLDKQGLT